MTTIGVDAGSFFALSAGPGGVNVGLVSRACSAGLRDAAWADAVAVLLELLVPVLAPLLVLALVLEPDEQAPSRSVPAASNAPSVAGPARRDDLARLDALTGLAEVSVIVLPVSR